MRTTAPGWGSTARTTRRTVAWGRRLACPTLVLWAAQDDLDELYGDVLGVWRAWTSDLRGHALACDHHMAEELATALHAFLREAAVAQDLR